MAYGKSLQLNYIRRPAPVMIHRNIGAPRRVRRSKRLRLAWKGALVANYPYIDPARDQRKGRKLVSRNDVEVS